VGEMRDKETTQIGIEASLTGHLVLTTLHTNSAAESVVRLIDMGMDPFNFADALLGVMSQRLVRTLCSHCKKPYVASDEELHQFSHEYVRELHLGSEAQAVAESETLARWRAAYGTENGDIQLYRAAGCDDCDNSGYRGRVGLYELLEGTRTIKKLIIEGAPVSALLDTSLQEGMRTLKQDGIEKILQGLTDLKQVRKVSTH
jgi:type II secretory ATPase GspE/PulE/Tfp pilus assembly ATPase PilB-like protein